MSQNHVDWSLWRRNLLQPPKRSSKITDAFLCESKFSRYWRNASLNDNMKSCAEKLREECQNYGFELNNSYCSSKDLSISLSQLTENHLMAWTTSFNAIFPYRWKSGHNKCETDVLFQIFFTAIYNGQKKTPLHVSLYETIHDTCQSNKTIQILNRMGLSKSYDGLKNWCVFSWKNNCNCREPSYTNILNNQRKY